MAVNANFQSQDIVEAVLNQDIAEIKKLTKDCPTLKALMNELTKMLADVKGQAAPAAKATSTSNSNNGPSVASACAAMAEMMTLLSQLEEVTGKFTQLNSHTSDAMLQSMATVAQSNMLIAQNQYTKLINADKNESWWDKFLKFIETVVAVIVSVVACICGQPELAVVVMALAILSVSGAFGEATKLISDILQACGMSKEMANIIASILVVIATIAVTVATCGAAAPEAAADVAGEVADDVADTAEQISEQADEIEMDTLSSEGEAVSEASNSTSEASNFTKIKNVLTKILNKIKDLLLQLKDFLVENNPFNKLSQSTNFGILTGSQAIMQTNFADNLISFIAKYSKTVAKEKAEIEEITNIILDIVMALASLGSMGAALGSAGSAATDADSVLGKLASKIAALASKLPGTMTTLQTSLLLASLAQAGGQAGLASTQFELAKLYKEVGETKAMSELYNMMMNMTTQAATQNTSSQNALITSQNEANNSSVASWTKEYTAIAQAMSA